MNQEVELKQKEVQPIVMRSADLIINDVESYEHSSDFLKEIKAAQKKVTEFFNPLKKKAHEAWKAICEKENELVKPLLSAEANVKRKMIAFSEEQERIRREEEIRLQKEAEARAEKEREKLLKKAEQYKTESKKQEALEQAEEVVTPVVHVESNVSNIKGISYRTTWKGEVKDISALLKAAADNPTLISIIEINQSKLNKLASMSEGKIEIPGIRFYEEKTIAAGGR